MYELDTEGCGLDCDSMNIYIKELCLRLASGQHEF